MSGLPVTESSPAENTHLIKLIHQYEAAHQSDAALIRIQDFLKTPEGQAQVNQPSLCHQRPLEIACKINVPELAQLLINYGAGETINHPDHFGCTALYWACEKDSEPLVKLLLESGAAPSVNQSNEMGFHPLLLACRNGNQSIVELLLPHCSTDIINTKTYMGQSALSFILEYHQNHDLGRLLIREKGAKLSGIAKGEYRKEDFDSFLQARRDYLLWKARRSWATCSVLFARSHSQSSVPRQKRSRVDSTSIDNVGLDGAIKTLLTDRRLNRKPGDKSELFGPIFNECLLFIPPEDLPAFPSSSTSTTPKL